MYYTIQFERKYIYVLFCSDRICIEEHFRENRIKKKKKKKNPFERYSDLYILDSKRNFYSDFSFYLIKSNILLFS